MCIKVIPLFCSIGILSHGRARTLRGTLRARAVPESVEVPNGATADIIEAWAGKLAYDPGEIMCPLFIIRGECDSFSNDEDAAWLLEATVKAPVKRYAVTPKGTHLLLLEQIRHELYRLINEFLIFRLNPELKI